MGWPVDCAVLVATVDLTAVDVFTGPNWLSFSVSYAKNAEVLARVLVATLDATAVN